MILPINPRTAPRAELAAWYSAQIGYDPFADDPNLTEEDVRKTVLEYLQAAAEETPLEPDDAFKLKQERILSAKLATKTRDELQAIIMAFVLVGHGSFLEEDYEGDSGTLGDFYHVIEQHGLRPTGNLP